MLIISILLLLRMSAYAYAYVLVKTGLYSALITTRVCYFDWSVLNTQQLI